MKLLNFDIFHCRREAGLSGIIDPVTQSTDNITGKEITHTAIHVELIGVKFVIDSQIDGTRLRSFKKWTKKYKYSYIVTRPKNGVDQYSMMQQVEIYLNSKYGFIDLLRHLFKWATRWCTKSGTGIWLGSRRSEKNLTCSEFVMRIFGNPEAYRSSPVDAFKWCLDNGHKIVGYHEAD